MRAIAFALVLLAPLAAAGSSFHFVGMIGHGAAACAPGAGCAGASLPQEQLFELGEFHGAQRAAATMTWAASTPLGRELRLGVSYDDASGDRVHAFVQGASPLTLDLTVPVQGELFVWANFPETVEGVPARVSAQQTFQIEGSL